MEKQIIDKVEGLHWPKGYSHAIRVGNFVFISGATSIDEDQKLIGENDMAIQTEVCYNHIGKVLKAAAPGADMQNIVMMHIFCTDLVEFDKKCKETRLKYFGKYRPATTAVEIKQLTIPGLLLEIDAIAVVD